MKAVGDEEVVRWRISALTDLESFADGRKRLKGYSQEDFCKKLLLFFWQRYFDRKIAQLCYILIN